MSSFLFREPVQQLILSRRCGGYADLANAIGATEEQLRAAIEQKDGPDLPVLIQLKLFQILGVREISQAINIIEGRVHVDPIAQDFRDEETGSIRWIDALDSLKRSSGLVEDKDLAAYLSIPPSTLSDFRRGKAEISSRIKLKILDYLGFHQIAAGIEFLMRDESAAAAKRARQRQARKMADQYHAKNS